MKSPPSPPPGVFVFSDTSENANEDGLFSANSGGAVVANNTPTDTTFTPDSDGAHVGIPVGTEFRDIAGADMHRIGNDGTVLSWEFRDGRGGWFVISTFRNHKGYVCVSIKRWDKWRPWFVHRLVLEAFVGPCPAGMQTRHRNGVKTDNRLSNLRWGTPKSNMADQKRHGAMPLGQERVGAKLCNRDIPKLLAMRRDGWMWREIARNFGISISTARKVWNGTRFRHVCTRRPSPSQPRSAAPDSLSRKPPAPHVNAKESR